MWRLLLGTMGVKSLVQGLNAVATAGFEPKTAWSEVRRRNRLVTAPPPLLNRAADRGPIQMYDACTFSMAEIAGHALTDLSGIEKECTWKDTHKTSFHELIIAPLGRRPQGLHRRLLDVCHAGSCKGAEQIDVGLWVAVCFLAKISFHRPTCKTTFARFTEWQAISQSFRVFITFRSMRDTTFFHFSKLIFCTKYRFFYRGDQKMSWWCKWRAVNFEIHLWSSGMNADCIWRSISIQHVQIEAGSNSDPGNDSFSVEIRDAKHVDRSTHQ